MPIETFELGRSYNRRSDIHDKFGGQQQGGIITPSRHPLIFAITGASGLRHGYEDEWTETGTFRYFGEGQVGDMKWDRGNKAIRDHAMDGKELLLFEALRSGQLRFRGSFNCAGFSYQQAPDRQGDQRWAIVFHLMLLSDDPISASEEHPEPPRPTGENGLAELRRRAYAAAGPAREVTVAAAPASYYARSRAVRLYVLNRAAGRCEGCDQPAPFTSTVGTPYLEPHHIRRLTDQGPDDPRHMAALCPNCHREAHYGVQGQTLNRRLQQEVAAKELSSGDTLST
jgi:5-methylcytosine-specific restriction protein A